MQPKFHIIIVTHNSAEVIESCINAIKNQGVSVSTITVVDSGSHDTSYLHPVADLVTTVIKLTNVGFSRANNIGYNSLKKGDGDLVLFLNPDAFLGDGAVEAIIHQYEKDPHIGCVTGKLLGYDIHRRKATGNIDSTGVFRKWYGRWYDRGQGDRDVGQYDKAQTVPAVCGALLCCSVTALQSLGNAVFDTRFFMYKEDIELSLRLRAQGWLLYYSPEILAYHCRGWQANRKDASYERKLLSAENEVKMYVTHPSVYIVWAVLKLFLVRLFRL